MADLPFTDAERFPLITNDGRRLLKRLREHPHAPRYTAVCGNRLTVEYLRRVHEYEAELNSAPKGWPPGGFPAWLPGFVEMCFRDVPFYRRYDGQPANFHDIPATSRADLSREIGSFVPDTAPLDDLIIYATSGTTGHPLTIPSHPVVGACYTPLLKAALATKGIELTSGRGQVCCVLVGYQRQAYTYPSVTPHQGEAGHLKLNLHPDDWRDPDDRARFLDDCNPELYTGDPIAFMELMKLPLKSRPKAMISTAMMLLPGLRQQLESHFGCPVLDVYSMNEAGPVAVLRDDVHVLLQHRLYVEILDSDGSPCPPGARGEVTLTGGLNFFLPLLRYRTNDYASLEWRDGQPVLVRLEGRPPVLYRGANGQLVNNLDVTGALKHLALPQFTLHQAADDSLHLKIRRSGADISQIHAALLALFSSNQRLTVEEVVSLGDKVIQYTSDHPTT
ncbi:MAG: capsule biosynthesis protein CapK [Chloroflexi bacterium]|nr:capsule biosynthesis protein CapK [Chloroflexota bacterium]